MTRSEQVANDPRYADWRAAYIDDVRNRVKHWGDKRRNAAPKFKTTALDGAYAPGGDDD